MVVAITALTLFVAVPATTLASAEVEQSSPKAIFALSVAHATNGKEAMTIRGASIGTEPSHFSAVATLSRVPCPGLYQYEAETENEERGALSAYRAMVSLTPFSPDRSPPCGAAPPPQPGVLSISVSTKGEPIDFVNASRSGSGGFFGDFTTTEEPVCGQTYSLSVGVDLRSWSRSIRYRLKVISFRSEAMGQTVEDHPSC